ncbi:hypothetical protein GLOIN_2v1485434 [Rhizophagus clarus]|uniref:Endonuclease/exonuclease/phosphatase domain-containing protein n=1 Tax=Rhizophagus clarus TaxID=94130 RepID=A0A8H3MB49_9GLOM|nr:hypothetical protein GLOIN_2v1485434 [Rhizophagus clarus]
MDFETLFLENEENYKVAFTTTEKTKALINKIKNFIYYSDVEIVTKLGNKQLTRAIWLERLLERRITLAKTTFINASAQQYKQTIVTQDLSTIVDHTEEPIELSPHDTNNHNQIATDQSASYQKSRAKKPKLKPITNTLPPDQGKNNIHQPPQITVTPTEEIQTNTSDLMEDIVSIKLAVDNYRAKNEKDNPMDIDLIGLNTPSKLSEDSNKQDYHHKNSYILELKTLSNDTFMDNSPFNEDNDHRGNLLMISDEVTHLFSPLINKDIISHFFTPKHSFLPNTQQVTDETQRNEYESALLPDASTKDFIYAIKTEESPVTYDVYIKLADVEEYFANVNKLAFIKILTRDFCGFLGVEINKDDDSNTCKLIKDIWSISLDNTLYRLAPANYSDTDMINRKKFSGEFVGFNNDILLAAVQDAYVAQNPKHVHFNNYHITGSPCNYEVNWQRRNNKLSKIAPLKVCAKCTLSLTTSLSGKPEPTDKESAVIDQTPSNVAHSNNRMTIANQSLILDNTNHTDISHIKINNNIIVNNIGDKEQIDQSSDSYNEKSHSNELVNQYEKDQLGNQQKVSLADENSLYLDLSIAVHNIRGMGSNATTHKLDDLMTLMQNDDIDIVVVTETNSDRKKSSFLDIT